MNRLRHTLLLLATFLLALSAAAQSANIRYVKTDGDNAKDGLSWANAKKDIQEAINDLAGNNLTGEVWVAAGTYYPTETTESTTSLYYKAFKIPAGITVRGGFKGDETKAIDRVTVDDKNFGPGDTGAKTGNLDGEPAKSGVYANKTILCGDLTPGKEAKFTWNDTKQQFDVAFYGNSYHVVWFAMNGFGAGGRANPLAKPAKLEGCVIEGGHANNRDVQAEHPHTAYGGGIYMVLNSFVYNCEVRNCDASRNGGGIYMDGGGIVRRTYVHDCQALGLGTDYGYGGGICQNGGALTAKVRPCVVAQSVVTNCVGRMGGGMAIMGDKTKDDGKYAVVANSTLVNNNTATIEGGGVYTYKGGGVSSLTIVANQCNGSGITQGGTLTGRSGGLYSYDASYVANTVMWGNKCEANNNVQFASARGSLADSEKSKFYHNAVSQSDNTDWSNTIRMGVVALDNENSTTGAKGNLGYPLFLNPTASAGYLATATTDGSINWTVSSESALTFAGVATIDLDTEGVTPAPEHSWDMQLSKFNSRPTIGAFVSQKGAVAPAVNITYNGTKYDYALFVDPQFIYAADNEGTNGATWEHPVRFLGNALDFIAINQKTKGIDFTDKKVAIFVKEGTVDNTRDAGADRIRVTSLDIPGNVSVFGSFDSGLTGTALTLQNVVRTPTIISARLMDQYDYNVAHLINIESKEHIHFEGFKLSFANASSTDLANTNKNGAAITLSNSSNITFRNIIVSNCTADRGAAVYADNTTDTHFENCIFHNNESKVLDNSGIIYATNGSALTFDHCDVLRNVGYASYLGTNSTTNRWTNSIFYGNLREAVDDTNIDSKNSDPLSQGLNTLSMAAFSGATENASGHHCMFDARSANFASNFGGGSVASGGDTGNKWQYNLQYAFIDGTGQGYPRYINPTKNSGVTVDGDATYYGRATSFEPHNNNPAVNMASHDDIHTSWGRDIVGITRDFGGLPDIGAVENHEAKRVEEGENAYADGQKKYGEGFFVRDYSPATGTQKATYDKDGEGNLTRNVEGKGIYTANGELLDGMSWEYAINGNAVYTTAAVTETVNSIVRAVQTGVDDTRYNGTFTISTGGSSYLYIDGTTPKTTTDATKAAHFEIEKATPPSTFTTGSNIYIRTTIGSKIYYLYRSGNNSSTTTGTQRIVLVSSGGGYKIKANNYFYLANNNGSITANQNTKENDATVWTITADFVPIYTEKPFQQDGIKEITDAAKGNVAQNTIVSKPLNFHVYKSLGDYTNSPIKKTYKIKRHADSYYLKNSSSYLYPNATGDDFALIQDGDYGKYYLYDVTTQKYVYYYSGDPGTNSRIRTGADNVKTTWWIRESADDSGKLNFIYGVQPWGTTEAYAITCGTNTKTQATVGVKTADDAMFVLVANEAYDVYNYDETSTSKTLNGLQYAVNNAHEAFTREGGTAAQTKEVRVGAGVYKSDPNMTLGDSKNENCYIIEDGVNVYGAFPKNGNPGMDQRQALISQYVHVLPERGIANTADFETILEPATKGVSSGVKRRVLGQPYKYNPDVGNTTARGQNGYDLYCGIDYVGAKWDGFTLREGVFDSNGLSRPNRHGGAGAAIYRNVTLKNVIVTNNTTIYTSAGQSQDFRAGGVYMDGGTLDAGYVINNLLEGYSTTAPAQNGAAYGGGMYIYSGTVFNSVVANNHIYAAYSDGAGTFIESADFFNNTIVNNKAEGSKREAGGIAVWTDPGKGSSSALNIYNTICINNQGYIENPDQKQSPAGNVNVAIQNGGYINLYNCITQDITNYTNNRNGVDAYITYHNSSAESNPASLFESLGSYGDTFASLNLRLDPNAIKAINQGNNSPVIGSTTYNLEDYNDMDFAERIQDCRIDIGAYEFNGATGISPDVTSVSGQAIFYVTPKGYGTTNAHDPENAACAQKLQRVLDAAGRYKYLNPGKQVIVKVANSYDFLHPASGDPVNFTYYATRTTDWTDQDVRVWSIIVPRGVEVWGGYTDIALNDDDTEYKVDSKRVWDNTYNGFVFDGADRRNITKHPTYFDSYYLNKLEKTDANTYHVVSFTDRIFDLNGYAYTKADFEGKTNEQIRTILQKGSASAYVELLDNDESHFVHLSEPLGGLPGISGNVISEGGKPKNFGTAASPRYASNRAVIDGIFVSGGRADAPTNSTNTTVNINSYGGAALVNDFAYVRNCILTGNTAINGGALALTDHALVSGCLIMDNEAHNDGGGIYVFENGTKLSNGTIVNTDAPTDKTMDYNMSHVFTSTIVQNTAQRGGGVWYSNQNHASVNVRFNSVAIWQNEATEQANVYGMINPEQPTEDETISEIFYPFSYSAIENARASGTNNLSVGSINHQGMRFVNKANDVGQSDLDQTAMADDEKPSGDKYEDFGYYGLTEYSLLCSNGMPIKMYNQLKESIAIADDDILGTGRLPQDSENIFVEIGARALEMLMPKKQLMLRLFVADPKYVDTKTATRFMRLHKTASHDTKEEYYSQVGSSFAYPFNSLQNALDYIKEARNGKIITSGTQQYDAQHLPFEILVGKGEYYPKESLNAETQNVWAATFAIPEGVTIMGGFNPQGGTGTYYGRYYNEAEDFSTKIEADSYNIYNNVKPIPTDTQAASGTGKREIGRGNNSDDEKLTLPDVGTLGQPGYQAAEEITFQRWHIQDIADRRAMFDNNKNGIIEPWEFTHQTIISGNAVNGETDGVYHVMTAVADEDAVGRLPKVQSKKTNEAGFTGYAKAIIGDPSGETGYQIMEEGQQIRLNGLIVTGGNALTYLSTALDEYGKYIFYQGAGLQVDGNRYKNTANGGPEGPAVFHNSAAYGIGYRDIPVSVTNCQFRNNKAGYGGAISTNGSLSLFGSSFEQNLAIADTEEPEDGEKWTSMVSGTEQEVKKVMYPGQGGAILATGQLSAFNTLFANNEARLADGEEQTIDRVIHPTFRVPGGGTYSIRAAGGAIMMGSAGNHHIVNCNFVRNKANAYPAVFTMNPTFSQNPADGHVTDKSVNTHYYSQIINTVAWGNEVNRISDDPNYLAASKLFVNVGKKDRTAGYITSKTAGDIYDPSFVAGNVPTEADLRVTDAEAKGNWQEASWFCAYEEGTGFTPNNSVDLRDAIIYTPNHYAPDMIRAANGGSYGTGGSIETEGTYQNCNILIVADNADIAGPNFGNPSYRAGFDGFMDGADWSPARFNRLTDNGNGWIKQTVKPTSNDLVVTFCNNESSGTGYQGAYPVTHYINKDYHQFPEYELWLAIGDEKYMQATNDTEKDNIYINNTEILPKPQKNYPRISPDPTMGVTKAYIDIGVYEYQKQPLLKPGNEVDILWVSTKEHPENGPATGATWKTPTSDLQRAIETLLSSRNGHKKEIRIMEGEYTPVTPKTVNDKKYHAFVIDTKSLNESTITPSTFDGSNNAQFYAQSLTIKGGYSSEIMYEYDPVQYKTVIRQDNTSDGSSPDHLFYIADPTLRYAYNEQSQGVSGYTESNQFGAIVSAVESEAKTMPIQIDGVTLINNKAAAKTKGSAIYYPDYTGASPITDAHPISVGGEVKYYTDNTHTELSGNSGQVETDYPLIDNSSSSTIDDPAKLVITKTQIVDSGSPAAGEDPTKASAVYIGQNGGSALIYNSVFHSNYGMPLDAYNTVNVNNTFGLNAGLVKLQDATGITVESAMHNSALWRNNSDGVQVTFDGVAATGGAAFSYNSYTGATVDDTYHLAPLADINANIAEGPNFIDPENADIEARNFDIKPSVRLLNKGSLTDAEGTYYDKVMHYDLGESKYANYDYSLIPTTGVDVLNRPRFAANIIDIGAYEFQGSLYNPLYVDPNKAHSATAEGRSWDDAFGYGDIQSAMDLVAIYHLNNPTEEGYVFVKGASATNRDLHTDETLTLRDGVTVYGSIAYNYTDWHRSKKADDTTPKYGNGTDNAETINAYITDMASIREGVASHAASKTRISAIRASEHDVFNTNASFPALLDGFVVTPVSPEQQPTAPVIDINNPTANAAIGIRNIIVADNDLSKATGTDINVAQVNNGLLYEVLMRDNKPKGDGAALQVSTNGYAVNVTVEGKSLGADFDPANAASYVLPVDGKRGATNVETATQIFYSVTNSVSSDASLDHHAAGADAPYGRITNNDISGRFYNIADANLNYQLTETSRYIDQCYADEASTDGKKHPSFLPAELAQFVTYRTDRDLLGNPRLLAGVTDGQTIDARLCRLDRGAFETWKVKNTAGKFQCGDDGTIDGIEPYSTNAGDTYTVIKKHYYPHDGSVCYIMEGQTLIIDAPDPAHEVKPTPHNPGYMLLKEGASFYGNRRPATCAYVAVERRIDRKHGSIIALPYDLSYDAGTTQPQYTDNRLSALTPKVIENIYDYDGSTRSNWQYIFQPESSRCWTEYSATRREAVTPANHGVLVEPKPSCFRSDDATETTFRFTAKGTNLTDFVYTEDGSPSRTITLTQYDDKKSDAGGADFTDKEDMGWNCIGLPYLVSDYRPYEIVTTTDGKTADVQAEPTDNTTAYRLHLPHTLWLYYDGVTDHKDGKPVNGNGGYYSADSWDVSNWNVSKPAYARIWVGEGIFTQTAAMAATETLTFYLPDPDTATASSNRRNMRFYFDDNDNDDDNDDCGLSPTLLRTEYYSVSGRRIARPETIGVTIVREIYSDGSVRTRKKG